jgi:hypothetical protein
MRQQLPAHRRPLWGAALPLTLVLGCAGVPGRPTAGLPLPPAERAPPAAAAAEPVYYVLHIEGRRLPAEVLVNEVPIERVEPDSVSTATTQVNMWIVPGRNRLRVRGQAAPGTDPGAAQLVVWLRRQQASLDGDGTGDSEGGNRNVARIEWRPSDPRAYFDQSSEFLADPAPPSELWQALPVRLDGDTRDAVTRLALSLEQALASRDRLAIAALLDFKTADIARTVYRSPADARASQQESLDLLLDDRSFAVTRLDPGSIDFDLAAGGRLVRLTRAGLPALQGVRSQGGRFLLPLYASNVGGKWVIAR